jgi:hypothetical protein
VSRPSRNVIRESRVRWVELRVRTGRTVALQWICPLRAIVSCASLALSREGAFSGPVSQHIPSAMQVRTTSNQRQGGPSQPHLSLFSPLRGRWRWWNIHLLFCALGGTLPLHIRGLLFTRTDSVDYHQAWFPVQPFLLFLPPSWAILFDLSFSFLLGSTAGFNPRSGRIEKEKLPARAPNLSHSEPLRE